MRRSLINLASASTKLILPNQSPKFRAAIFTPYKALILGNDGRLKTAESPDCNKLQDVEFDPINFTREVIARPYSDFAETDWSQFLSFLNPAIIGNLKPQENHRRQLLDTHNACLSNDAKVTRNRSSVFGSLPLTAHLLFDDDFADTDYNFKRLECLQDIDAGSMSPPQILRKYFSSKDRDSRWATDGFLKNVALAPSLQLARLLGELLAEGAKKDGEFNAATYSKIVQNIPNSNKDQNGFEEMWNVFRDVLSLRGGSKITSQLLLNIGKNWEQNRIEYKDYGKRENDYFEAIAKDLLLPIFLTKLKNDLAAKGEDMPDNLINPSSSGIDYLVQSLSHIAAEKVTALMVPKKLIEQIHRWDIARPTIDSFKPKIARYSGNPDEEQEGAWHAIIPNQEIDGYNYAVLTNQSDLMLEAENMGHCIGGYPLMCRNGECHIISGLAPSGEGFTLELRKISFSSELGSINGDKFRIHQIVGVANQSCSKEAREFAENLLQAINSDKIIINQQSGALVKPENLETWLQFDPFKDEERQTVFKTYCDAHALPPQWLKHQSLDELISKSGIGEVMDQRIKRDNMGIDDLVNEMEQNIGTPLATPNSSIFATMFQNFFKKNKSTTNSPSQ